jgi:NAD(P)-dependent dehydrogenase (short-subunit alcohol dehydrogenase family)
MDSTELSPTDPRVVIITGSTSGIGLLLAHHLHNADWCVVISGRRPEGEVIAAKLSPDNSTAIFVQCDVASYSSQAALFKATWNKWHRLDALIANAGGIDRTSLYHLSRRNRT